MTTVVAKAKFEFGNERLYIVKGLETGDLVRRLLSTETLTAPKIEDLQTLGIDVVCDDCGSTVRPVRTAGSGDAFGRFYDGIECSKASVFEHAGRPVENLRWQGRAHQPFGIANDKPGDN